MKTKIILQIGLCCLLCDTNRSPAACRTTTATATSTEIKVSVPFAIPVGVPVAPLAPYFYSYQTTQEHSAKSEEQAESHATTKTIATSPSSLASQASLLTQHCSACHGGSAPKAGLSLESVATLALADRLRAVHAVASGRMPKGESLSADEVRALINELTQTNHGDTEAQRGSTPAIPTRE